MIGKTVSHYRILEKIGSGGMGEVFLAEDSRLQRQVALKFLTKQLTTEKEARERFKREAQAAAALNHPNIVTVYEIGEHEGQVFIAMEYVDGHTLKEIISTNLTPSALRPMPISQVIEITTQIASGLAAAHAKGIVHRDIKPQNILIDKDGRVKILDFGLAKLQGASRLTQEAFAMGTVYYMSPEQGMGNEVDARSDIWSLGVVMYEMASGNLPFRGDFDQAVIYAILNEDTPPLGVGTTPDGVGIENVIRRCLAKKHQDRYPSAEALAAALRDLGGAREVTGPEQVTTRKPSRRTILTAITLLLLSGFLGFLALNPRARAALGRALGLSGIPQARHIAVLPLIAGSGAESKALADGFTAVMIDKLTRLEKFHNSLWTITAGDSFQNRDKPQRMLQRLWGCNLFVSGDLQAEKNSLHLRLKLLDAAYGRQLKQVELEGNMANLSLFQDGLISRLLQLLELPEEPSTATAINAGGTSLPGAYNLFLKGVGSIQANETAPGIERGIVLLERALRQDEGYDQARLALFEGLIARFVQSRDPDWLHKALKQGCLAREDPGAGPSVLLAWALLMKESGQKTEAVAAFQQVLQMDERCYEACIGLANCLMSAGKSGEAETIYKRAVRLRPGYAPAYDHIAFFYHMSGRVDEALVNYQRLTELAPGNYSGFNNMGSMYLIRGDKASARKMFGKSNALQPNSFAQSNLATIHFYSGEYLKALPLFREAAEKSGEYWLWGNLADTYRQLPEWAHNANSAYQKAIAQAEALLASTPQDFNIISCLAMYYAHTGDKAKALDAIARARTLAPTDLETIRREALVNEAVRERSRALAALREYRERLGSLEEIEKEPDLAALRRDPAYHEMLGRRQ